MAEICHFVTEWLMGLGALITKILECFVVKTNRLPASLSALHMGHEAGGSKAERFFLRNKFLIQLIPKKEKEDSLRNQLASVQVTKKARLDDELSFDVVA